MATLLLTAVGTLIGGPIGGALGALAGQQLDLAVIGSPTRKGPRLKDLSVQTSSYGAPIARHYGRMRVAGSVIWATELKESREKSGGGKGKPKLVTYSYSSSFAVALASRPILGIGRIWADGNLLRGAAGDLKAGGALRVHRGHGEQPADPLIAAAEGAARCPAFRNLAYLVFEDLALADFGNRIPSLTVEVFADDGPVSLGSVLGDALPEAEVAGLGQPLEGYSIESGSGAELLDSVGAILPLTCTADGGGLRIVGADALAAPVAPLPEPLADGAGESDAAREGLTLRHDPAPANRDLALRYYDVARDYQPGLQRARGRSQGAVATVEFPAALEAAGAMTLAGGIAARRDTVRQSATCRIASGASAFAPGRAVALPGRAGSWVVESWELDSRGVELGLRRIRPAPGPAQASDAGRANLPSDLTPQPSLLAAFELPWDGIGNPGDARLFAAVSAERAGWSGAALFAERADASLDPLGGSGRVRATLGAAEIALGAAPATVLDRANALELTLAAPDLALISASAPQLAAGANRVLLGEELLQFARAEPLGGGRWRLSGLLRGRGGTEWAIAGHAVGDRFVLVDDGLVPLDPGLVGDPDHVGIAALGLADPEPVRAEIALPGVSRLPLSPVHGRVRPGADGGLSLSWVRRARGAWLWRDGIEVPLVEQSESYLVTLGALDAPVAQWLAAEPSLTLAPAEVAALRGQALGEAFAVRQRGDHGLSRPLPLGVLT